MGKPLIVIGPITYAMKSREILRSRGFNIELVKTPKGSKIGGCGYSIYVKNDDIDDAIQILKENGINVLGRLDKEEL